MEYYNTGLNYWWTRFDNLRKLLKSYRDRYKLKDVEEVINHMLERLEEK